jgi:drug/metabolite transporter (DMT)-like permease
LGPVLALCSALSWGTGDFCGGIASRLGNVAAALGLGQLFGFLLALAVIVARAEPIPDSSFVVWAAAGGISGVVGLSAFYLALSRGTMGLVAPLTALVGATVPAAVGIAAGQVPGPLLATGMVVALAAVGVISLPEGADWNRPGLASLRNYLAGARALELGLVLVAGLGFAGFFLGADRARSVGGGVWWPLLVVRVAGLIAVWIGIIVLLAAGKLRSIRIRRSVLLATIVAGAGDTGGNFFYLLASAQASLPVAVVLSSLYPVQTTLLARFLLHERLSGQRLAGVALAVLGVVLISLGAAVEPG